MSSIEKLMHFAKRFKGNSLAEKDEEEIVSIKDLVKEQTERDTKYFDKEKAK